MTLQKYTVIVAAVVLALGAGCSFTKFNDFEDKAPAAKIEQEGDIKSGTFGLELATMARENADGVAQDGALLLVVGNAKVAINNVAFSNDGTFANSQSSSDDITDDQKFGNPDRVYSVLAAPGLRPATPGTFNGPYAYVGMIRGQIGSVLIMDVNRYDGPAVLRQNTLSANPAGFGAGLARANIAGNATKSDDLIIGGTGSVTLWPAKNWPTFEPDDALTITDGDGWPATGQFEVLAAGDIDLSTPEDEIVVASPEKNYVAIIHHVADCLAAKSCSNITRIKLPDQANGFGSALVLADVDGDQRLELVVGAPDSNSQRGAVYVFKLKNENFDLNTPEAIADPTVLSPTNDQEGREFGTALAFGAFEGPGKRKLLAVGAPASDVAADEKTTANAAGKLFFYDKGKDFVSTASLASPVERDRLGRALISMPFKRGDTTYDVLVTSAVSGVYAFWAFLTDKHDDVRK